MFTKRGRWKELGMNKLREQGSALLFYGPTGTGKTITAKSISKRLKLMLHPIDFSDIGSNIPGQLARNIKKLFESAAIADQQGHPSMVLLDECDTLLMARTRLGRENLWMLEPINQLLVEIRAFKGLVILCTNMEPTFLDPALDSRLLGKYNFELPSAEVRSKLWESKWPSKLPVRMNKTLNTCLSKYPLTGAQIENVLIDWVSASILNEPENFDASELEKLCGNAVKQSTNSLTQKGNQETGPGARNAKDGTEMQPLKTSRFA
jgi:AAA+ superfamily predicted ATPase